MKIVQPVSVLDANLVSSNVTENDYPDYSATAIYILGDRVKVVSANVHKVYESLTGKSSTVTISIASPGVISWVGHGLLADTPISFTTTGTLPTGIVAGTVYYVKAPTADSFNISATVGGANINTSGTQSGVHTARASTNFNKTPSSNPAVWLDAGSTNRWKMFDKSVQSQTTNADSIQLTLTNTTIINTMAFLNVDAASITVSMSHPSAGLLYEKTIYLTSYLGVYDWYTYFFSPIDKQTDAIFDNLPKYNGMTINVVIDKAGGTAACGVCLVGYGRDISSTGLGVEHGAKIGIDDYSIKSRDDFGNYTIVQRAFNRRTDFQIVINSTDVDAIVNLLSSYRATPILYIGGSKYKSTVVYGFYKNFEIDIAYPTVSYCSIQLEGLT